MERFKDFFSKQSDIYVKYRPLYPPRLYDYLAELTAEHHLAWDCGTGNGQAAIGLASHFDKVVATDPSEKQIENAIAHPKVEYRVEKAEQSGLSESSVDLVTVANALHWFDFSTFYDEVRRVSKRDAIFAAWACPTPYIEPEIDKIIFDYHDRVLNDYWRAENRLVENEYRDIPFPFDPIVTPTFSIEKTTDLDDLMGYLNTWSATQRYIEQNGINPTETIHEKIKRLWDDGSEKKLVWHLTLKVGRVSR